MEMDRRAGIIRTAVDRNYPTPRADPEEAEEVGARLLDAELQISPRMIAELLDDIEAGTVTIRRPVYACKELNRRLRDLGAEYRIDETPLPARAGASR
jgi:hypothetical protein